MTVVVVVVVSAGGSAAEEDGGRDGEGEVVTQGGVPAGHHRLRRGPRQRLEVPLPLLPQRRRSVPFSSYFKEKDEFGYIRQYFFS